MPSVAATNMSGESVEKAVNSNEFNIKKPAYPKGALSPFMLYAQANRFRLRKANPDARFGLIGKLLHSEWSGLTDDEKKPYIKRHEEDKTRFERDKAKYIDEMAEYEANLSMAMPQSLRSLEGEKYRNSPLHRVAFSN